MDEFNDFDDGSSTAAEMARIWDKLDVLQDMTTGNGADENDGTRISQNLVKNRSKHQHLSTTTRTRTTDPDSPCDHHKQNYNDTKTSSPTGEKRRHKKAFVNKVTTPNHSEGKPMTDLDVTLPSQHDSDRQNGVPFSSTKRSVTSKTPPGLQMNEDNNETGSSTSCENSRSRSSSSSSSDGSGSQEPSRSDDDSSDNSSSSSESSSDTSSEDSPTSAGPSQKLVVFPHRKEDSPLKGNDKVPSVIITKPLEASPTGHGNRNVASLSSTSDGNGLSRKFSGQEPSHEALHDSAQKHTKRIFPREGTQARNQPEDWTQGRLLAQSSRDIGSRHLSQPQRTATRNPTEKRTDDPNSLETDSAMPNISKVPKNRVYEHAQEMDSESEIPCSYYAPIPYHERPPPMRHEFTIHNKPVHSRPKLPISTFFNETVANLWKGKFDVFNAVQSELANALCHSDDHTIVSAPTGAGKTTIFEMAFGRFVTLDSQVAGPSSVPTRLSKCRKVVYIAPSKALCEERYNDWSKRFPSMEIGIEIVLITGDVADVGSCFHDFVEAHVVLTTPEKWDSFTRRWTEKFFLFASVKLLMVDEVHLLGDESRGYCLESIIARMKTIQRAAQTYRATDEEIRLSSYPNTTRQAISSCMRIVAVSATLPNICDVADFIGANEAYVFDESYRPVPLTKHVVGLGWIGSNEYKFWTSLDRHVPELIRRFSQGKQTLVFCHSQKGTETLVNFLIQNRPFPQTSGRSAYAPGTMQYCFDNGIAFHHAGMGLDERKLVEKAFSEGQLRCLCATATLAVGVNLPAHLVIVKGTKTWRGGCSGYQEVDRGSLLQMIGRAGRPGLDTSGTAVIMTDNKSKKSVEQQILGLGAAESNLLPKLVEVLNTEISQHVVTSLDAARLWCKGTFLFSRRRAIGLAGKEGGSVEQFINEVCDEAVNRLLATHLIESTDSQSITPLAASHIMSNNMIPFDAMRIITNLPFDANQCRIIRGLCEMEMLHLRVRRQEKRELNECHKGELIKFKMDGPLSKARVQEPKQKAFVLLQAYIGQYAFKSFNLGQEMSTLAEAAQRILVAAQEYSVKGSKHGQVALECLKLRRSIHFSLWGQSSGVLNQIPDVGHCCTNKMKFHGIVSFEQVLASSDEEIEKAAGKGKPFGRQLRSIVEKIVREKLKISAEIEYTRGSNIASGVVCRLSPYDAASALAGKKNPAVTFSLVAFTDLPGSCIFFKDGIVGEDLFHFSCPPRFGKLYIHLVASLIGLDDDLVLDGNEAVAGSSAIGSHEISSSRRRKRLRDPYFRSMHPVNVEATRPTTKKTPEPKQDQQSTLTQWSTRSKKPTDTNSMTPKPIRQGIRRSGVTSSDRGSSVAERNNGEEGVDNSHKDTPHTQQTVPQYFSQLQSNQRPEETSPREELTQQPIVQQSPQPVVRQEHFPHQRTQPYMTQTRNDGEDIHYREPDPGTRGNSQTGFEASDHRNDTMDPPRQVLDLSQGFHGTDQLSVSNRTGTCSFSQYGGGSVSPTAAHTGAIRDPKGASWNAARRKQQRSQRRAFASKKDNPFVFFKHDPNDAENFLESLSSTQECKSNIIPDNTLASLGQSSRPGITWNSNRSTYRGAKYSRRRRQTKDPYQNLSGRELLMLKAAEQNSQTTTQPTGASYMQQNQAGREWKGFSPQYQQQSQFSVDIDNGSVFREDTSLRSHVSTRSPIPQGQFVTPMSASPAYTQRNQGGYFQPTGRRIMQPPTHYDDPGISRFSYTSAQPGMGARPDHNHHWGNNEAWVDLSDGYVQYQSQQMQPQSNRDPGEANYMDCDVDPYQATEHPVLTQNNLTTGERGLYVQQEAPEHVDQHHPSYQNKPDNSLNNVFF